MKRRPSLRATLNHMRDQQIATAVTASRTAAAREERKQILREPKEDKSR